MASRIVHIIWTHKQASGAVEIKTSAFVAALTEDEWEDMQDASDWLTAKNRTIVTDITPTVASGGDHHDILSALKAVAKQYNYPSYGVDCSTLKKHGIERCDSPPSSSG